MSENPYEPPVPQSLGDSIVAAQSDSLGTYLDSMVDFAVEQMSKGASRLRVQITLDERGLDDSEIQLVMVRALELRKQRAPARAAFLILSGVICFSFGAGVTFFTYLAAVHNGVFLAFGGVMACGIVRIMYGLAELKR